MLSTSLTQAFHLDIQSLASPLSVFAFEAEEQLNSPYWVVIKVTCANPHLRMDEILGRKGRFSITPVISGLPSWSKEPLPKPRYFNGVITQFSRLRSNQDETLYSFRLEPRMAASLRPTQASRIIQHSSVPKIIEAILRHTAGGKNSGEFALANGGLAGNDFAFKLRKPYPEREYTTQFNESNLNFINRLAEDVGMFYYFTQTDEAEVLTFGDDLEFYLREKLSTVLYEDSGLNSASAESVFSLSTYFKQVPQEIKLNDYNYRRQDKPLLSLIRVRQPDRTTLGQIYEYGEHYKTEEEGLKLAKVRHEELLSEQIIYHGRGNVLELSAGTVFTLSNVQLPDAEFGLLVTSIKHSAARDQAYQNSFTAIPSHTLFRPKRITPWPQIKGTIPARIAPTNHEDAYLDAMGRYIVTFNFDLDEWRTDNNSRRVRLAKPFAGGNETGFHFPLLEGTEVAIAFTNGDPDRPYIAHVMHDSSHPDHVTHSNPTRNVIRTQSNNKLRMEDKTDQEHIKLSTEFGGKSQLNLGHLVDSQGKKRGEGFELRTDSTGSIRAGKGLFISSDAQPQASGKTLEMQATRDVLKDVLEMTEALNRSNAEAKAELADLQAQKQFYDDSVSQLQQSILLLSAPAGIAAVTPESIQLSAGQNFSLTAGKQADISVLKKLVVAVGEAISFCAHKTGIKLFASQGKIEIQAQNDALDLLSAKKMLIASTQEETRVIGKRRIIVQSGGAYIKLEDGNVEIGAPGDLTFKTASFNYLGPDNMTASHPDFPKGLPKQTLHVDLQPTHKALGEGLAGMPYTLYADGAEIQKGLLDDMGQLSIEHEIVTRQYKVELSNGTVYHVPVPDDYEQRPKQGTLANQGFQQHQYHSDPDVNQAESRDVPRQSYFDAIKTLLSSKGNGQ